MSNLLRKFVKSFNLKTIFVIAGLIVFSGLMTAAVFVGIKPAKIPSNRALCRNGISQIAIALRAYKKDHGRLPPLFTRDADGNPAHSWRVLLLPYLESVELYDRYNFSLPWNHPQNLEIAAEGGVLYSKYPEGDLAADYTFIVAVAGSPTSWGNERLSGSGFDEVLVIESPVHKTHWMAPNDLNQNLPFKLSNGVHRVAGKRFSYAIFSDFEVSKVYEEESVPVGSKTSSEE